MGTILVLFTVLTWDSIKHVAAAPSGLSKQQRKAFLREASHQFQAQMGKRAALSNWGHSDEVTKHFAEAMKEVRDQALKEEHWKLNKDQNHKEMAHRALVMYKVMSKLLLKYGKHLKQDHESCQRVHEDVGNMSGFAVIDSGANSTLISPQTVKHKGLLDKVNKPKRVTLSQAEKDKRMEMYSVI